MSRRFSIIKTIDYDKISSEIEEYKMRTGEKPYLFMHIDTIDTIWNKLKFTLTKFVDPLYVLNNKSADMKAEYEGCKMYVNNDLKFGEVEIR